MRSLGQLAGKMLCQQDHSRFFPIGPGICHTYIVVGRRASGLITSNALRGKGLIS